MTHLLEKLKSFMRNDSVKRIQSHLPPLNFITVHYSYFIILCMVTSVIFWGSSDPRTSISYTDSLFLVVSAMTEAGLNTVNLSTMTTFQQLILWFLIVVGSPLFVSISMVLTRKRVFETRFKDVVKRQKEARRTRRRSMSISEARDPSLVQKRLDEGREAVGPVDNSEFESRHSGPRDPTTRSWSSDPVAESPPDPAVESKKNSSGESTMTSNDAIKDAIIDRVRAPDPDGISVMRFAPSPPKMQEHSRILSFVGVGAHPNSTSYRLPHAEGITSRLQKDAGDVSEKQGLDDLQYPRYLTRYTTGRNGQVYGISKAEREHLGGVEYRAITLLAYVVPLYFVLWQLLGCLGLGAWIAYHKASTARENGINPWWLGIFNGASAFNNSGMSLLDANMIPFQDSIYVLFTMGLMILAGNTAYPLFLRLILWTMLKALCLMHPSDEICRDYKATLRFVLQYPRRVYTNLFPSAATWWLFFMVIILNGTDWAAFELLNIGNAAVEVIPRHYRVLDGLFQALAVRSGGFYIISITSLRIGLQFLYVIMMYISVYPVVITMRHSNVYEERSLGIYADDTTSDEERGPKMGTLMGKFKRSLSNTFTAPGTAAGTKSTTGAQFVRQQIRGQLAHDLWWLVLAIFFISCIEVSNFERDPVTYSVFNITFEVVSGYGCVGISTGLPNEAYSFSGGWHVCSKLILIAVMLRGRHRGLPVALDRAVRLPGGDGGELGVHEEEDHMVRTMSRGRSMVRERVV